MMRKHWPAVVALMVGVACAVVGLNVWQTTVSGPSSSSTLNISLPHIEEYTTALLLAPAPEETPPHSEQQQEQQHHRELQKRQQEQEQGLESATALLAPSVTATGSLIPSVSPTVSVSTSITPTPSLPIPSPSPPAAAAAAAAPPPPGAPSNVTDAVSLGWKKSNKGKTISVRRQNPFAGEGKDTTEFGVELGVLAIHKGEVKNLREWILYHELIGVQHFWLLSNECGEAAVRVDAVLEPFVKRGLVTASNKYSCSQKFQRDAYRETLQHLRKARAVKWLGVFDIDEFLFTANHTQLMTDWLRGFDDHKTAAIAFNRLLYGPSDQVQQPNGSVIASYTRHVHPYIRDLTVLKQVKMVIRVDRCLNLQIHGCDETVKGAEVVTTHGVPFEFYQNKKLRYPKTLSLSGAWMHHYYTRSLTDYMNKNKRGSPQYGKRHDTGLPVGLDDVFNNEAVESVKARLATVPDPARVEEYRSVLLSGELPLTVVERWGKWFGVSRSWSTRFMNRGKYRQDKGKWPIRNATAINKALIPLPDEIRYPPPTPGEMGREEMLTVISGMKREYQRVKKPRKSKPRR